MSLLFIGLRICQWIWIIETSWYSHSYSSIIAFETFWHKWEYAIMTKDFRIKILGVQVRLWIIESPSGRFWEMCMGRRWGYIPWEHWGVGDSIIKPREVRHGPRKRSGMAPVWGRICGSVTLHFNGRWHYEVLWHSWGGLVQLANE